MKLADCNTCGFELSMKNVSNWRRLSGWQVGVVADCPRCEFESKFVVEVELWSQLLDEYESSEFVLKTLVDEFVFDVDLLDDVDEFMLFARECTIFEGERFDKKCGCGRCGR